MGKSSKVGVLVLGAALMGLGGCAAEVDGSDEIGMRSDELITVNGMKTINGLSVRNGLKTINGLKVVNGLKTINGLKTVNGLPVDCKGGKVPGVSCDGEPDGALSNVTGMMSTLEGVTTAHYAVRCALPATDSVAVVAFNGELVTLPGEMGLAPEWAEGTCNTACQEKISACLLALTNSAGNHVNVELAAPFTLGRGHSSSFPYEEAVFYGNVFESPPKAYFAVGKDFAGFNWFGLSLGGSANRLCGAITNFLWGSDNCPYTPTGKANYDMADPFGTQSNFCNMFGGAANSCRDKSMKTWNYPITTYRKSKTTL